ncbi:helix-turn-helix transcriptional regulator [Ruminococcaceae bacterium OttesenSCG-928-D13]|nr:helix-turn-helix transcriptional regulator [Ruminococcaceae bacterium OttesenSCG-928-D13]
MAQTRSFKEYVANHFYNDLFAAVSDFLDENHQNLNISSQHVRSVDGVELSDITVKHVYVDSLPGMKIAFDVLLEADMEISEEDRHNDRFDEKSDWFKISCSGDLSCNLDDFMISHVEQYSNRNQQNNPLSDNLVPIIKKDQLETVARSFLEQHYPEALYEPTPMDPNLIAQRMGLSVELRHITSDFSTFGQMFFVDSDAEYYDKETETFVSVEVKQGTIFVDPDAYFLRNLGSVNNTIIHECVHWDKHRKAFELERLYNENATQIKCLVVGGVRDAKIWSPTDWMEWQANSLTPRIQMPFTQAKIKATEIIQDYSRRFPGSALIDIMEPVIDEMALFFGVSRMAAKIRMIDLGFEEAIGTFTYIDGRYVRPHSFKKGALERNQTFSISERDAIVESSLNPALHAKISSGNYLFVDSHFCINDEKYVTTDDNNSPRLTTYARHHIDECCLLFELSVSKSANKYGQQFYTECVLYRDATSDIVFEASYKDSKINSDVDAHAQAINAYTKELSEVLQKMPGGFSNAFVYLMEWKEITVEKLAETCSLSPKTIQRLRTTDDYVPTIESVVAICIALQLPPVLSDELIRRSPCSLGTGEKHLTYKFMLSTCNTKPIHECNDMLQKLGFGPLTKEQ